MNETNSPDAKTLIASGCAKSESGDHPGAMRDFDHAILLDPTSPEGYFERGKLKQALRDQRGASQDINQAQMLLKRLDEGLQAHEAAEGPYNSDDYHGAIRCYNKALSLLPSLTSDYYWRGAAKQMIGDDEGAIQDFSKCIEADASNKAEAHHQRGKIKYHKLDDSEGAVADFSMAIALCPTDADIYFSRALALTGYEALRDLDRAIELNPNEARFYFARAVRRQQAQDFHAAIEDLNRFIALDPTDTNESVSEAYSVRGAINTFLYDYAAAVQDYISAIELDPSRSDAYVDSGYARYHLTDYDGALSDFNHAIALAPSNADAYQWRGLTRVALGQQAEGEHDMQTARSLGYTE